jgi:farnesyl-diphosphate farnesyltransferase
LQRFGEAQVSGEVRALTSRAELEDYTYRVAGCVGDFWTRLCVAHLQPKPAVAEDELAAMGVAFGQGLQLVNILRDLPRDLRQGRCYLPADELRAAGLLPRDLLDPRCEARLRPVYERWREQAQRWLEEGWRYTLALPRSWHRLRLACALPILLGIKTLAKLRGNAILAPDLRLKVTRAELRGIVGRMLICYPWPKQWNRLPAQSFFLNP